MKEFINKKEKQLYIVVILVSMLVLLCIRIGSNLYVHYMVNDLSNKVIRFHVVANSDTTEDQLLKMQVRDEIIRKMEPFLKESKSIEQTRTILQNNRLNIQKIAEEVTKRWKKSYPIYVALDHANFPTKAYGDIVFPAGEYEACRVVIGEGKGENWWCVLFPPLCYVDAATGVVPMEGKQELKENLNKEQYDIVSKPYEVRFKLLDFFGKHKIRIGKKQVVDYKQTPYKQ